MPSRRIEVVKKFQKILNRFNFIVEKSHEVEVNLKNKKLRETTLGWEKILFESGCLTLAIEIAMEKKKKVLYSVRQMIYERKKARGGR